MSKEFLMPELAESVVEGEIVKWLVAEGETVTADQPLVEVMTDKVTVELPSPYEGVLEKQLVKEGDVVPVQQAIAIFADGTEALKEKAPAKVETKTPPAVKPEEDEGDSLSLFKAAKEVEEGPILKLRRSTGETAQVPKVTGPYGRVLAVPAARKLARAQGIDINQVPGSGPNGRIRVEDVKQFLQQPSMPAKATVPQVAYVTPQGYESLEERQPLRGLRRMISKQMLASHLQTVRTLHVDEADVSALVDMRRRLKPLAEKRGVKLSYLPFIMKATVAALKQFPMLNASLDESANEVVYKHYYNLGMAVATQAGLIVPVIKDVDKKSILQIAADVNTLSAKAKEGKLAPDDVKGGSFSITNIGSLGGLFSFPIINVPEAAILGVHSIKKRPVVLADDSIVAREMLYLSLSFDHRVIDGAEAAMFTSYLIELLQTPESLLLEV